MQNDANIIKSVCTHDFLYHKLIVVLVSSLHQTTPLHLAALGGDMETVEYLVTNKADISVKGVDGVSLSDC